ncbi:hypothetical protein LTR85_011272 [Meristemomyces frigidus]|nr:hypothetical protein LTR85_011272 [Meristemomyces frigidus]
MKQGVRETIERALERAGRAQEARRASQRVPLNITAATALLVHNQPIDVEAVELLVAGWNLMPHADIDSMIADNRRKLGQTRDAYALGGSLLSQRKRNKMLKTLEQYYTTLLCCSRLRRGASNIMNSDPAAPVPAWQDEARQREQVGSFKAKDSYLKCNSVDMVARKGALRGDAKEATLKQKLQAAEDRVHEREVRDIGPTAPRNSRELLQTDDEWRTAGRQAAGFVDSVPSQDDGLAMSSAQIQQQRLAIWDDFDRRADLEIDQRQRAVLLDGEETDASVREDCHPNGTLIEERNKQVQADQAAAKKGHKLWTRPPSLQELYNVGMLSTRRLCELATPEEAARILEAANRLSGAALPVLDQDEAQSLNYRYAGLVRAIGALGAQRARIPSAVQVSASARDTSGDEQADVAVPPLLIHPPQALGAGSEIDQIRCYAARVGNRQDRLAIMLGVFEEAEKKRTLETKAARAEANAVRDAENAVKRAANQARRKPRVASSDSQGSSSTPDDTALTAASFRAHRKPRKSEADGSDLRRTALSSVASVPSDTGARRVATKSLTNSSLETIETSQESSPTHTSMLTSIYISDGLAATLNGVGDGLSRTTALSANLNTSTAGLPVLPLGPGYWAFDPTEIDIDRPLDFAFAEGHAQLELSGHPDVGHAGYVSAEDVERVQRTAHIFLDIGVHWVPGTQPVDAHRCECQSGFRQAVRPQTSASAVAPDVAAASNHHKRTPKRPAEEMTSSEEQTSPTTKKAKSELGNAISAMMKAPSVALAPLARVQSASRARIQSAYARFSRVSPTKPRSQRHNAAGLTFLEGALGAMIAGETALASPSMSSASAAEPDFTAKTARDSSLEGTLATKSENTTSSLDHADAPSRTPRSSTGKKRARTEDDTMSASNVSSPKKQRLILKNTPREPRLILKHSGHRTKDHPSVGHNDRDSDAEPQDE